MNDALRVLAISVFALTLAACGSDADDSLVSNDGNGDQVDNGDDVASGDPDGDQIGGGDTGDDAGDGDGDGDTDGDGDSSDNGDNADSGNGSGEDPIAIANSAYAFAQSRSDLSTLVAAIDAADQKNTLSSAGAYTLLAPDNAAFDRLFAELGITREQLFANQELVSKVLRYHMIGSNLKAADLPLSRPLTTYEGSVIKVEQNSVQPIVFDGQGRLARVTTTDLDTANATIHVVDRVMLPADKNIVQLAVARDDLSILAEAVAAADLAETLSGNGPFTLLAPNNDAFAAALSELGLTKAQLLADQDLLRAVLSYHVIPGTFYRADVPFNQPLTTVQGQTVSINELYPPVVTDARGREANLVSIDTIVTNGVVHILDRVILPAN